MFKIFLCIVIGHAFGELQRIEIGKDDLKARENAREDLSPNVKEGVNLDQYLQSKDAQLPAQSRSSNETEIDEKPSSLVIRSPVTSGEYEAKKSGQKKVYIETRVADIRSLWKHSDRNISAKKDSMKFRSFPVKSAAIRHTGKDFAIKKRRSFRGKRGSASNEFERMMEPAFGLLQPNTQPKKISVRALAQKAQKNTIYTEKEEKLVDVEKSREQGAEPPTFTHSVSPRIPAASYSAFQYLLNKLPEVLKSKILITDDAEKVVLENYVKSQSLQVKTLDIYNSAKKEERELLKRLLKDVPIILPSYKSLRKGVAWNYTRLHDKFRQFFQKPSTALEQYEALKKDELASLDSFLAGSSQIGVPESTKSTEAKSSENKQMQETDRTRAEEADRRKAEGKDKNTVVAKMPGTEKAEMQIPPTESNVEKSKEQTAVGKTKAREAAKQNLVTEASVEDVEELKPEIKQTAEVEKKQTAEERTKAGKAEKQKLYQPKIIASEEADERKAVDKENPEKQHPGDTAKAKPAEKRKPEETAETEEGEKQTFQEKKSGDAKVAEETNAEGEPRAEATETRKAEETAKTEEGEKQTFQEKKIGDAKVAEETNAEGKPRAEATEPRKAEETAKIEEGEKQTFQEKKIGDAKVAEETNAEGEPRAEATETRTAEETTKAKGTDKQSLQKAKLPTSEEAIEQKAEKKVKAGETEKKNLEVVEATDAEDAAEQRPEEKPKAEKAEKQAGEEKILRAEETQPAIVKFETEKSTTERNDERKAKAEDAEKQKLEEYEIGAAEEAEEQKAENKTKAEEAEGQTLEEVEETAAEEAEKQKAEGKAKAEETAKATEANQRKNEMLEITEDETKEEKADEQSAEAEERKAEDLEWEENETGTKERLEPYCGPLKVELSDGDKQEILKAHNDARRKEHATNMLQLVWDNELAIIAQYKANTCGYFHSMHKDCSQRSLGQNLFTNFMISDQEAYPSINYTHTIVTWANERVDWNWTTSSCLKGMICTHWMAVTGAQARRLGCGKSECPTLNVQGKWHKMANFIVCNYGPFSMDFERGRRCSHCSNSTADLDEKGFTCENDLCVPCDPRRNPKCKCGRAHSCHNGGKYSTEFCGCICPREFYGNYCEMTCKCEDINLPLCKKHASQCHSKSQKSWILITCQKTCNTCSDFPRPASCAPKTATLHTQN